MRVLMLAPGYPAEMPLFTRGLARVGAEVWGLGDSHEGALPEMARRALAGYIRVPSLWDEHAVLDRIAELHRRVRLQRVECLWEPGMMLAARLREEFGIEGLGVEATLRFRDKEKMKLALDGAGLRTPRHARASSDEEIRAAAERIGYPLIVKPIAGAGSQDTYRVDGPAQLDDIVDRVRHVPEVSVEEYVEGEEFTFDTICAEGRILFHNVAWYRPKPLIGRSVEWISPQTVTLRDPDQERLRPGLELGARVLRALGFRTGFTHMEWFLTPRGEAVFGEIAARPPGARSVDLMNYAQDIDVYSGWAEAVCRGTFSQVPARRYNSAVIFKRAQGQGRIRRIEGLERLLHSIGPWVTAVELSPLGAPRRDWRQTLISDGFLIVRHPDLGALLDIADRVGTDLQLYAE